MFSVSKAECTSSMATLKLHVMEEEGGGGGGGGATGFLFSS